MSSTAAVGEQRVVLHDVSWQAFCRLAGEARGGRMAYDRGSLEIMSPSFAHETVKWLIGRFIEIYAEEQATELLSAGSTTFSREDLLRGIEADECYYVENSSRVRGKDQLDLAVDPAPDLAVEVDISRSSIDKLAIFASLGVREVWRFHNGELTIYRLDRDGVGGPASESGVLPGFPLAAANRLLRQRGELSDSAMAASFRALIREGRQGGAGERRP